MTSEFTIDFRLEVFHPAKLGTYLKDESQITVAFKPVIFEIADMTGMAETVPISQWDAAIARVSVAAVQSVLRQNEERKTKPE